MLLAARLCPDPRGAIAFPRLYIAVIRGGKGEEGGGLGIGTGAKR